ncbi:MAG TPA: SGNH/GDSL hydrolase family protein [Gemmatimonadaceae bacterium]|nr:SGNH/GDSL hydrolase family protein [Gemmatimonadaceae bacterium]
MHIRADIRTVPVAAALVASLAACVSPRPFAEPQSAAQFASEIAAFDSADRANPPAQGGVVFTGSSSIRLWPNLAADFPGVTVSNRGFGGSTLPDVSFYIPHTVLPARPRLIVVYAGDNDLASGRTPAQIADDYRMFVRRARRALPGTRIVYVSIKPSPSRWSLAAGMCEANALIAAEIAHDSLAAFVNVFDAMLGPTGYPRAELFQDDSLHMTAAGYVIWRDRLAPVLSGLRR